MIRIIQHKAEGAHLKVAGPAVVILKLPHEWRYGLAILTTGYKALVQSVTHGMGARTKVISVEINLGMGLGDTIDTCLGIGIFQHFGHNRRRLLF